MRACPKCSLLNPDSAVMCDCGHPFDPGAAQTARADGYSPRHETHPPGPSGAAKFGMGVLGYFLGAFPLGIVLETRAAMGHESGSGLWTLSTLLGLSGVVVALHLQKKRYESRRR
jgi:hypothetical protein